MARAPHRTMSHKVCIGSTPVVAKGARQRSWPGKNKARRAPGGTRPAQFGADITQNAHAVQRRRGGAAQLRDAGSDAPAQWPRRRRLGRRRRRGRYSHLRPSSRLHSSRSVLGLTFLRHQSLQPHAPGSPPQHVRCRRHAFSVQKRNDPSKSHCARRTKSARTRDGRASHCSSVSRPGKFRVFAGLPFMVLRPSRRHRRAGDDASLRSRDAASHPSFAYAKKSEVKKPSQEASPKTPPLKEGRRSAERRTTGPHRQAMRRAPFLLSSHCGKTEAARTSKNGAGALAFRRPTAASEVLGLGSAQAALPGTTGCKREDPLRHQCSEHLAVRHAPDGTMPKPPASAVYRYARREPPPLRPKEYPRDKASHCERDFG